MIIDTHPQCPLVVGEPVYECFKCGIITEDWLAEKGYIESDRAMCESCKQDLGKAIEKAVYNAMNRIH